MNKCNFGRAIGSISIYEIQDEINMPRQQEAQHARNQANTSNLEDGETCAVQQRVKAKWTVEMNTALLESRKEAEQLHSTDNFPRKDNGRKDGIMELTNRIWDEKRFAHLRKTPQNLRDHYAYQMKTI